MRGAFLTVLLVLAVCAHAAAPVGLAPGLRLLRIKNLDTELGEARAALAAGSGLILDLRNASASMGSATLLEAALAEGSGPELYRAVLLNADTGIALTARLPFTGPSLVVLAPADDRLRVDVAIATPTATDREAVAALDRGVSPLLVLDAAPPKGRDDEAALADHHAGTSSAPLPAVEPREAQAVDVVLTRAVQLHVAWLATRKNL
ncbi:hypothetical protein [Nibricoccus sp. IMCC34717]|uniref:hypothetical protein n=1 Tax=Nibricoccus sp. IMCC34717 TaxID=3034021 RepID=UPI00384ABBDE